MLVSAKEMLTKAKAGKYAVGQFNINNLEWTKAILQTAEELKSPVILGVSEGAGKYMCGYKTVVGMVNGMLEEMNITVPVALHLDHGSYEGEVADPKECKMIADLGVTMLAAGIGNIHGKYPANWTGLRFDTLAEIQELTGTMPLVLHGGTGIPADMIKKAISLGVSKINVNTECQLAFAAATRKYIEAGKDLEGKGFDPRKLLADGSQAIKDTVKEKMELFGSVGKA